LTAPVPTRTFLKVPATGSPRGGGALPTSVRSVNPPRLLDRPSAYSVDPLAGACSTLLQALPVGVALFAPDGSVLRMNPAFRTLLDAAGGATAQRLDDVATLGADVLEHVIERGRRGERVGPVCLPFGRTAPRLVDATVVPLAYDDDTLAVALVLTPVVAIDGPVARGTAKAGAAADGAPIDASQSWAAELDALLAEQARRARERRLAAVGQLAAGVMHDVNNALNPIVAAAHLLQLHAADPDAVRDYALRIARAAETAAITAARVGRFIRQEPLAEGTHRLVDLGTLAEDVAQMTRPLWAERAGGGLVRLDFDCPPGSHVRGCAGELREALLNLVQNALDAMQGGGVLGVRVVELPHAMALEVSDTGPGMSSEVRERAFEPFFTTKGVKGTGLGLSEVWGVMKRHRGHAEIDSTPGQGTTVRLVFPTQEAPRRPSGEMLVVGGPRVTRRVLLVEDHEDSREFMRALLVHEGHHVEAVRSAGDARARLREAVSFDVLLTDLGLPDANGWDLVREVRVRWPGMRVGVVTGWEPHAMRDSLPVHFTLRKPVRIPDLIACVGAADA
jgi:signal transduction histidine kinase